MTYKQVLTTASDLLKGMNGKTLDVLEISKPSSIEYAQNLAKVISKLSPLIGNMIEFATVEKLNEIKWDDNGHWIRQDPGFPDALFVSNLSTSPGIEIKTWFPLATEITARFKDSIVHFKKNQTNVALIAWLPEYILYGKPKIVDVWIGSAKELAIARDKHYHNPPDYLVFEPEDTSKRTANLQQTNTNGYKFQGNRKLFQQAEKEALSLGINGQNPYDPTPKYQQIIKKLLGKYPYRLDTNFAKIDRIEHQGLEEFKTKVLSKKLLGNTIQEWSTLLGTDERTIRYLLEELV
ncbi:hypothetical protein A3J34_04715 [Candidatus Peribacteria bacterium RIFCSPLOWO2_02_FULL_51_10]|nr:MAG: hypothetical protein A3C52_03985 [Candidatus Peribacteria bacterium RIFCSPHIGHO2_02_FULL_51_15]OGJ68458.1 MAG: hypothetical protein A3J34_04715 [Candidatus Peribacteria bacterium RIFCSPLOWO2_02_FULL_51_10]